MYKLCFGRYAQIIKRSIKEPNTQVPAIELLLGLITDNEEIIIQTGDIFVVTSKIASSLLNCKLDIHSKIKEAASLPKILDAANYYFEDVVMPQIIPDMKYDLLEELKELVNLDNSVPLDKKEELLSLATIESLPGFLKAIFFYVIYRENDFSKSTKSPLNAALPSVLEDAEKLKALIKQFRAKQPTPINPPKEIESNEMVYVTNLLSAYAEAEGIYELCKDSLANYPKYEEDLARRRKDYYAAETIRRGSRDLFGENDFDEFDILKEETYDGIIDVYHGDFSNGLARLRSVMSQAAIIRVDRCFFTQFPNLVGASQKKGVCHMLVNDGDIKGWVEIDE